MRVRVCVCGSLRCVADAGITVISVSVGGFCERTSAVDFRLEEVYAVSAPLGDSWFFFEV